MEKPFVTSVVLMVIVLSLAFQASVVKASDVHDVAVTGITVFPFGVLYPWLTVSANVTVENQGTVEESFNVTLYAGNLTIQTLTVSNLAPGLSTILTFEWEIFPIRIMIFPPPWDPWRIMRKCLNLTAEVSVVDGEVDTSDNVYVDGVINVVWMVPDVNYDGKVDMKDLAIMAKAFGSSPGNPRWNPDLDFNQDGKIDMRDISPTARAFGRGYT
jgi:hypothetical protein